MSLSLGLDHRFGFDHELGSSYGSHFDREEGTEQGESAGSGNGLNMEEVSEMFRPVTGALGRAYDDLSDALYQNPTIRVSLNILQGALTSNSLWTLTRVSLANGVYLVQENPTFYDKVTARIAYLESAVMSLASMVTRVVLALLVTVAAAVTFGQLRKVNDEFIRQWVQAALSTACFTSSIIGIASPTAGALCNAFIIIAPITMMSDEVIQTTGRVYRDHREPLKEAALSVVPEGRPREEADRNYLTPFFNGLDGAFTNAAESNLTGNTARGMAGMAVHNSSDSWE